MFVFFHLQNFALKIYTSLFKNQTRSAKKKPIQNPEETGKGSKTQQNPSIKTLLPPRLYSAQLCNMSPSLPRARSARHPARFQLTHASFHLWQANAEQFASAFYDQASPNQLRDGKQFPWSQVTWEWGLLGMCYPQSPLCLQIPALVSQ